MKFKGVLSQLSHDVCELEQTSSFSKSFHSERGFPGILAHRLLQGQAELTGAFELTTPYRAWLFIYPQVAFPPETGMRLFCAR